MFSILCLAMALSGIGCATGYDEGYYAEGLGSDGYYYDAPRPVGTSYYDSGPYYYSAPYYYGHGYHYRHYQYGHHHHHGHDYDRGKGGRDRDRHDTVVRERDSSDGKADSRVRDRNQQVNTQDAARSGTSDRGGDRGDRYRGGSTPPRSEARPVAPRGGTRDSSPSRSSGNSGGDRSTRSPSK